VGPLTGRSIALFDQTEPADPSGIEVLRGDWQTELLGCSLTEYIGVTQLLMAAAMPNNGRFDPTWIEREDLKDLTNIFDPAITRHVLHRYLVADASTFRIRDTATPSISRRFTFNPLIDTPVVSGLGPDLLMPIPDYMIWKPTPSGLFYRAREVGPGVHPGPRQAVRGLRRQAPAPPPGRRSPPRDPLPEAEEAVGEVGRLDRDLPQPRPPRRGEG
jgi:hypothetical protein